MSPGSDDLPRRVGVLGAGTMGAGIAMSFALAGSSVRLCGRREATRERARRQIAAGLDALVVHGGLGPEAAGAARDRIALVADAGHAVEGAALVAESVVEDLEVKCELLANAEREAPPDAVLTTNTSSLPLAALSDCLRDPARFAALHWFNPPELVELVEIVAGPASAPATLERLVAWARAAGKTPVRLRRDIPGFVANRLQYALVREAHALVEAGICDRAAVDAAVTAGLGARWAAVGPFESMDLAGLDVHLAVAERLFPLLATASAPPPALAALVAAGDLGVETGRGLRGAYSPDEVTEIARRRAATLLALARLRAGSAPELE
jgi:3-hydroxybutyryl-CoA dehydrogenase